MSTGERPVQTQEQTMNETTTTRTVGWMSRAITLPVVEVEGEQFLRLSTGVLVAECWKCMGRGGFEAYLGLHGGVCYRCNGSGVEAKRYESEEKAAKVIRARKARAARAEAKREAEAAAAMAARDEWAAANPEVAERLAAVFAEVYNTHEQGSDDAIYAARDGEAKYGDFVLLMANYANYKALTEAQTEAVIPALDEALAKAQAEADRAAAQRYLDVPQGAKVVVTGTVVTALTTDGYMGGSSRLVIVEGTGDFTGMTFKMFGTGATLWETERGEQVEVTATVKDFSEYNGTPQTVLTRAKIKTLATT